MKAKRKHELSMQSINAAQGLTMTCGLIGALYLVVFQVAKEGKSIGQLATFLAYWSQIQGNTMLQIKYLDTYRNIGPLFFFSGIFRSISYSLMDAERLLELFRMKPTIKDNPQARPLVLSRGEVRFSRASFSYSDRAETLKNVNFVVPAGQTVALVGESGGGKSTILKLIGRFYDVKSGSISIDGQDIRDVTLQR